MNYYALYSDVAKQNGNTCKYYYSELASSSIASYASYYGINGLCDAFSLDVGQNKVIAYNFTSASLAAEFNKTKLAGAANVVGTVVLYGDDGLIALLNSAVVYDMSKELDWCVYKDTRNVEGHETYKVKITVKDYGEIVLLLDATTAPITVANFIKLVSEGFYNGLTFHRIIKNFMIQGGDPLANGTGNSDETITGEFSQNGYENDIKHLRGVISMARSNSMNSASCQFFICNEDATKLDGSYAAFGYVIEGMDVVCKITADAAKYADRNNNGAIATKSLQPVIEKIELI